MQEQGFVPISQRVEPSAQPVQNYSTLLACQEDISIVNDAISKTNNCYISENSLILSMSFILVMATTHVINVEGESKELQREMRLASEGAQMMHKMLSNAYGNLPLFYIKPECIFSTDDT
eukprot:12009703-Ditylum_brightwellii.AAC.1